MPNLTVISNGESQQDERAGRKGLSTLDAMTDEELRRQLLDQMACYISNGVSKKDKKIASGNIIALQSELRYRQIERYVGPIRRIGKRIGGVISRL